MTYYMAVTSDKYEIPIFVTNNIEEMAEKFNVTKNGILSSISHNLNGAKKGYKFVRVVVK